MGSASVHLMTGVGGRALRQGDVLEIGNAAVRRPRRAAGGAPAFVRVGVLRVTQGPQAGWFHDELYCGAWVVSEESNRMGIRLRGAAIPSPSGHMITEGVPLGAIQVPPDGQPIVLFVEHQTTGGYPKIATVISADLPALGRLPVGSTVAFEPVTVEVAETARRKLFAEIDALRQRIVPVDRSDSDIAAKLLDRNLVSGFIDAAA